MAPRKRGHFFIRPEAGKSAARRAGALSACMAA